MSRKVQHITNIPAAYFVAASLSYVLRMVGGFFPMLVVIALRVDARFAEILTVFK